jgi:glycosyltransferase involved in cell wall biosynthesis
MNKHICFVIPSLSAGGAERVVSILANYLVSINYSVSIVCLKNETIYPINKGVDIIFPDFEIPRNLGTLIKVVRYYRKTIKRIEPDVILSFLEFYNEITMLSLLGIKKKIYLFDRNNPYLKEQNIIQAILRKYLYPKANGVIVQTKRALEFIKHNKLNANIFVFPNPISEISSDWNPGSNKIITCVGRMETQKNQKFLIKIFSELPYEEWMLQFVGDGSLRHELEEYVKTLHLEDKVKFLGTRKDVQNILSKSTIFAFPSLWEGFPNALLEAMAVGVPSISNNCNTGPSELIQDGVNGFLVDIGDEKEFKNKLHILMQDKEKSKDFSSQSQKVKQQYSIEILVNKLLQMVF